MPKNEIAEAPKTVIFKIVKDPSNSLRKKSVEVPLPLSPENKTLLEDMMSYLRESQDEAFRKKHPECREGVGLSAPQVGRNLRMLVVSYQAEDGENPQRKIEYELVNPKIVANSLKKAYLKGGEGCLSVDDPHPGYVYRDFKVVIEAYDNLVGKTIHITARGYEAIVLQHEIDHLNGVLFYDHIDPKDPFKKLDNSVPV